MSEKIYELLPKLLALIDHYEDKTYKGKCGIHYPVCKNPSATREMRVNCPYRHMQIIGGKLMDAPELKLFKKDIRHNMHGINGKLAVIKSYTELITTSDSQDKDVQLICESVDEIAKIVSKIMLQCKEVEIKI